jgi:hypothetical protein
MKWTVKMNLLILFLLTGFFAVANDSIIVKKDPRLDILSAKQAIINKRSSMMTPNGLYRGFRVQVLSTRARDEAFKTKSMLLSSFPEAKTYVMYQSPSFKVRIGNFLKREDAEKFRKQLAFFFPQGAYIVEDEIEYTPAEDEDITAQ